ncbi:GL25386 [Drosophila persimilis]|uniref:GL25386 n=1 Tax=Drosophila persimilis TaxID=7234 RepID=B4GU52_DROPE|nr:GL25386 [Drosophila persimilis]
MLIADRENHHPATQQPAAASSQNHLPFPSTANEESIENQVTACFNGISSPEHQQHQHQHQKKEQEQEQQQEKHQTRCKRRRGEGNTSVQSIPGPGFIIKLRNFHLLTFVAATVALCLRDIIQDEVVMTAFRDAIQDEENAILFKGATVLEVGCGSAILSMWVAKQGAARVFAVDAGDVAQAARQVVRENHLDHVIEVMQANTEELELPPVDVIISKWMGAKLYLSIADDKNSLKPKYFWKKFEGMDMHRAALAVERTAKVTEVLPEQMISNPEEIWQMDLRTLKREEVCFTSNFRILSERRDIADLFVIHFDFAFPAGTNAMTVNTSPWHMTTRWM